MKSRNILHPCLQPTLLADTIFKSAIGTWHLWHFFLNEKWQVERHVSREVIMSRPLRLQFDNAYYHVYNRGVEKRSIFSSDDDRRFFLNKLDEAAGRYRVTVFAFCLMSNHFHLFIRIRTKNMDRFMQKLQWNHALMFNLKNNRVGPLFQGRYKAKLVEADAYATALVRYIHRNPVEAGVSDFQSFKWSSYRHYKANSCGWLDKTFILDMLDENRASAMKKFEQLHRNFEVPEVPGTYGTYDPGF